MMRKMTTSLCAAFTLCSSLQAFAQADSETPGDRAPALEPAAAAPTTTTDAAGNTTTSSPAGTTTTTTPEGTATTTTPSGTTTITDAFGSTTTTDAYGNVTSRTQPARTAALRPRAYGTPAQEDDVDYDDDDERRRDVELFWLRPTVGYTSVNLTTFEANEDELTGSLIPSRLAGAQFGLGAGLRALFISFGLNGSVALFGNDAEAQAVDDMQLWTLDGNILLHLLSGYRVEPYIQLGGGYSAFGGVDDAMSTGYSVHGWNVHGGIGLDYFASDNVSVGGLLSGSLMFLTRPGVSATALLTPQEVETVGQARARLLEADGSSIGTGFSLVVGPSLHF